MSQAQQTSISEWETAVRTAAGRCSFGVNADEFMRDKFLFARNESFSRFREDIFYREGQRKPEDPPFTLAFVVSQAISFEVAQHTNTLLASSTIEEQVHYTTSTSLNKGTQNYPGRSTRPPNRPCFFCGSKQQHSRNMPSFRTNLQLLPQNRPLRKRLPTGGQRPPQLETHLPKAYSTGP